VALDDRFALGRDRRAHRPRLAEHILLRQLQLARPEKDRSPGRRHGDDGAGRFSAILDSLLTPRNQLWHQLASDSPEIMGSRDARLWYEAATKALFRERYDAIANFTAANQQVYYSLGAYGTGGVFIDQAVDDWNRPVNKLRYKNIPIGELFHSGKPPGTHRQRNPLVQINRPTSLPEVRDKIPPTLLAAMEQKSEQMFDFLHCVQPQTDYEEGAWGVKGCPTHPSISRSRAGPS
jgi:hypothetical protein